MQLELAQNGSNSLGIKLAP